ncbi:MAG: LytR C-terminal domain-containing protein [Solirubrobacterales bacterium]
MLVASNLVELLYDVAHRMPTYVSLAACVGFLFLLTLYVSQRRDLVRLQEWMSSAPEHPGEDIARSEALLDRAEAELEEILGVEAVPEEPHEPTVVAPPPAGEAARQQTTSERPALEQITTEREALLPHPRWHRFWGWVGQPRVLALIALGAVILGVAGIFGSERLLNDNDETTTARNPSGIAAQSVSVAVLNGTTTPGLAGKVASDVEVNDFTLGDVGTTSKEYDQTVVMYERGQKKAAGKVARALGVKPVQPIDAATQKEAGGADVVVVAGRDRAL